jgi:hypothetical protein
MENIKQVKGNECGWYKRVDQDMFCPHSILFPLRSSLSLLSSMEPGSNRILCVTIIPIIP